ncbi:hypothetical protein [Streptomyces sp. SID14515]|uniref:hypothetical protein n=1 Tax=Streptomyces sp. SID14515 TaxID=2706074 RepID=UPI0013CBB6B9|nr:hypothetical protein [Streptomyces sp. SID14515]NEB40404.1 hypothetical protein [Streptomyces sp. SID14515]
MKRRWVPALVLGGLWWWAVLRLVLQPDQAGLVEGAVAAGGWGLSLLPVHVASMGTVGPSGSVRPSGPAGSVGPVGSAGSVGPVGSAGLVGLSGRSRRWGRLVGLFTRAWRRRRSGGGSGRS